MMMMMIRSTCNEGAIHSDDGEDEEDSGDEDDDEDVEVRNNHERG